LLPARARAMAVVKSFVEVWLPIEMIFAPFHSFWRIEMPSLCVIE
jgi:hypothetical protein